MSTRDLLTTTISMKQNRVSMPSFGLLKGLFHLPCETLYRINENSQFVFFLVMLSVYWA